MRLKFTVFILLFISCVNSYSQDKKVSPADYPNLEISEQTWDFGTVTQGEQIRHSFILKNIGKQDLIIKKIKSTCGCTVTEMTKKSLKPKESGELSAVFNSLGRKGKQLKRIYIKTNDPVKPLTTLIVKGFVNVLPGPLICVTPKKWDYGLVRQGTTPQRTFIVKNIGVKNLVISKINTSSGCHAELLSTMTVHPSEEAVLNVTLDKLNMIGLIEDFVTITSNDTSAPNLFIRINGYVKGLTPQSLKLLSDRIDLGVINFADNPKSANFKLTLFNIGDKPLTVTRINTPKKFIKKFKTPFAINPHKNKSIDFSIKKNNYHGTFKNIIIIHSNDYNNTKKKIILFGYAAR